MVNVGGDLAKLVPGRVSTEVDARLAYDTNGIVRKVNVSLKISNILVGHLPFSTCLRVIETLL